MWNTWDRRENCSKVLMGKAEGKAERLRHRWEDEIQMAERMLSGFTWLRIGASGGLL
jgi:hypothetical protein